MLSAAVLLLGQYFFCIPDMPFLIQCYFFLGIYARENSITLSRQVLGLPMKFQAQDVLRHEAGAAIPSGVSSEITISPVVAPWLSSRCSGLEAKGPC